MRQDFFEFTPESLGEWCNERHLAPFRAKQILEWVYVKNVIDPAQMTTHELKQRIGVAEFDHGRYSAVSRIYRDELLRRQREEASASTEFPLKRRPDMDLVCDLMARVAVLELRCTQLEKECGR